MTPPVTGRLRFGVQLSGYHAPAQQLELARRADAILRLHNGRIEPVTTGQPAAALDERVGRR